MAEYKNRKEYTRAYRRERRNALKTILDAWKQNGCSYCEEKNPLCLDAHHINPKDKAFTVGSFLATPEELRDELKKCICVCANCHRKIHAGLIKVLASPDNSFENLAIKRRSAIRERRQKKANAPKYKSGRPKATYRILFPDGREEVTKDLAGFCVAHSINRGSFREMKRRKKAFKGYWYEVISYKRDDV